MLQAVSLGVDGLEFDLHVSRDGMLVVMHDDTLDRTTSGKGPVATHTLAELRTLDAGAKFTPDHGRSYPYRGRGVGIPTFDEVVESVPRDLPLIVELKTSAATAFILSAIQRHNIARRVIVAGFDSTSLWPLRGAGFALGASSGEAFALLRRAITWRRIKPQPFQALCIPPTWNGLPLPLLALARAAKRAGIVTHVWTINDPADALKLWRGGIQGIISDDPGLMLAARSGL